MMANFARDTDIGTFKDAETTREVLTGLLGSDISDIKSVSDELLREMGRTRRANELILGQEVEESE